MYQFTVFAPRPLQNDKSVRFQTGPQEKKMNVC